ncbi:MAG: vanadium-dependent haloperoxidase [bacterium]|nr:vanadium-dependent haloperoxidase [bacterium]
MPKQFILSLATILCFASVPSYSGSVPTDAEIIHQWNRLVIEVIMEDGFAPPIAARIHSYANLAAYQAAYHGTPGYRSMVGVLNTFAECPKPNARETYDWRVSAVAAYQTALGKLLYRIRFSDSLAKAHFDALEAEVPADVFARSKKYGIDVGKSILAYAKADGYARTQGLPDWEWPRCDSCWEPTPPNFAKPLSPYCGNVRTIALRSVNQFTVPPSIPFSKEPGSEFYRAAMEVYDIGKAPTDEQKEVANFWNDNPVVTSYHGHFIFNSRQISPGGHWMNIAMQVLRDDKASMIRCIEVYATVAFALNDGFTSCWEQKFKGNLIRPVTYINKYIDPRWEPLLQTPPFPEHASGHSTITAAAAEVLTHFFGERAFIDSTEVPFGLKPRSFPSFRAAALEASNSRFYGGIHYRRGCDAGNIHGTEIGKYIVATVTMKEQP